MKVAIASAAGLLLLSLASAQQQLEYQEFGKRASIRAKRPIEVLANQIQRRYGVPVNYEDIKTRAPSDIVDETAPTAKASNPTARALGRREGQIEIDLEEPAADRKTRRQQADRIIRTALLEHERAGNNGLFSVIENSNFISIVPRSSRGRDGRAADDKSPLETLISVEPHKAIGLDCVHRLIQMTNANGVNQVRIGLLPENYLRQIQGSCSAQNEPARDVLQRALYFSRIDGVYGVSGPGQRIAFVWRLFYDIEDGSYTLSIVPATQLVESRFGGYDLKEILVEAAESR